MDIIPPQYQLDPNTPCGFCLEEFGLEYELVCVESGKMVPGRKDRNHLVFLPDWKSTDRHIRGESVIEFFHLHCFLTKVGKEWKGDLDRGWSCGLCPEEFWHNPYAFGIRIGHIHYETLIFDPLQNERNFGLLCSDCTCYHFGEGDCEEGKRILSSA